MHGSPIVDVKFEGSRGFVVAARISEATKREDRGGWEGGFRGDDRSTKGWVARTRCRSLSEPIIMRLIPIDDCRRYLRGARVFANGGRIIRAATTWL